MLGRWDEQKKKNSNAGGGGDVLLDTAVAVSVATFSRLARSGDFFRSIRPDTKLTKQEVSTVRSSEGRKQRVQRRRYPQHAVLTLPRKERAS